MEAPRRPRPHEPALDHHRDGADRAVAAHRQAPRDLDEENADVAVGPRRRVEDRARHHLVPARLVHEAGADPVVLGEEMLAPLAHAGALEERPAAGDDAHRVPAGMRVDAEESVARHQSLGRVSIAFWMIALICSRSAPTSGRRGARTVSVPTPVIVCASLMYWTSFGKSSRWRT